MINIAILGFGTVGSGCAEVITRNSKIITARIGDTINIKYILDLREFPDSPFADRIVHDFAVIRDDPEISIVDEMMGGVHPAADFTRECLMAGKSVVTSNKAVVAAVGDELLDIARQKGVRYLFEAAVGGGIPVIRPLIDELADNEINSIAGILNGTTNYILTEMRKGTPFDSVLRRAQQMGYAEADPSADVDGFDAARKIIILAAIAYGKLLPLESVFVEGIRNIPSEDVSLVAQLGASVKLIAYTMKDPGTGKIYAAVTPRVVMPSCPLCHVDDVFNGVLIDGNVLGETMFYGRGAGKLPTASAVVSDIIDAAERPGAVQQRLMWKKTVPEDIADRDEYRCRRCFILTNDALEQLTAHVGQKVQCVNHDGMTAAVTEDALTDSEASYAAKMLGKACLRVYRVI